MKIKYLNYLKQILWVFYRKKFYWSFFAAFTFGLSIYLLNTYFYPSNFWNNFTIDKGIDTHFCEHTDMEKLVRQPVNTFTNIWYLVNALFFISKGIGDYKKQKSFNLITANPFYSIVLGIISIYTFVSSTFFHSSLISIASKIDYSAVYGISLFPLMYYLHRIILIKRNKATNIKHPKEVKSLVILFTFIYILLTLFVPLKHVHIIVLIFILLNILGGYYIEKIEPHKTNKLYLFLMATTIIIAITFFKMDISKIACSPDSLFQAHSLWHIFNSLTVFYIYLYFRSENYIKSEDKKVIQIKNRYKIDY